MLNSLTSCGMVAASLSGLGSGAGFVEIGKRDIWSTRAVALERMDVGYSVVAVDFLPVEGKLSAHIARAAALVGLAPRSADIALTPPHRALQRTFLRLGHAALPAAGAQAHRLDRRVPECGGLPGHLGGRHGADTAGVLAGDSVRHGRDECRGVV